MPKFSAQVALTSPEYVAVTFGPGDEVPDWALDLVGPHVIQGVAKSPASKAETTSDDDADEPETVTDGTEAPDFTTPKPRQTRTRRK